MTGVSIIIPVYNALEEVRRCIDSIYATRTSILFEVIVVDNGSRRDAADWLASQQRERAHFRYLRFPEPLGFARAVNAGAAEARFGLLAVLNSDTIVACEWLDRLAAALDADLRLGVVSPFTNRCGNPLQCDPDAEALRPEETERFAASIAYRSGLRDEPQRLVFFCVVVRRTLWLQLGGLDESYGSGNFEDDDFCLRARMAGSRLAVVEGAFVFHHERRTFDTNQLNHGEWLARNQSVFSAKASRWSRERRPVPEGRPHVPGLTVIVPVNPGRASGFRDSLASLANQTVQNFETVVTTKASLDLSGTIAEFANQLRIRLATCGAEHDDEELPATLLNCGLNSATGSDIAYLPAGDVLYPFHLEVLVNGLASAGTGAVFSAWNVVVASTAGERRGTVMFPRAAPDIELGDWAPLICWMHRRMAAADLTFEPQAGNFAPWLFQIQLRERTSSAYVCRATCERHPDRPSRRDSEDVVAILRRFPTADPWKLSQRQMFIEAVTLGGWEDRLVVSRNDRARRVRALLEGQALGVLRQRFQSQASSVAPVRRHSTAPDVVVFTTVEWASLTQRQHHFASGLARRGHRVFWIDVRFRSPERVAASSLVTPAESNEAAILQSGGGVFQVHLPAFAGDVYRMEWQQAVLDTWVSVFDYLRAAYGISSAVQLVNYPRWQPLCSALASRWKWPIVYDCLDDQNALGELFGHRMEDFEGKLLDGSTAVVVSGLTLLDAVRPRRPDAILIPNAADFDLFHSTKSEGLLATLERPVVGFFGAFADWLDFEWMEAAAERFPRWSFVYVGRENFARTAVAARWRRLAERANVHVCPAVPQPELAKYLAEFDVCTMPFRDTTVTRSMNAVKLYEYLAAGKPVVASHLPETRPLRDAGLIETYTSLEESWAQLEKAVQEPLGSDKARARIAFASVNNWDDRLRQLSQVIARIA